MPQMPTIPAVIHEDLARMLPGRLPITGDEFVQNMVWTTLSSLPEPAFAIATNPQPSTNSSAWPLLAKRVWSVTCIQAPSALQPPKSLWSLRWVFRGRPSGILPKEWEGLDIAHACRGIYDFVASMIQMQLFPPEDVGREGEDFYGEMNVALETPTSLAINLRRRLVAFIAFHNLFSETAGCWNEFPFSSSSSTTRPISSISAAAQKILTQVIDYANESNSDIRNKDGKIIVAFAIPPTRFYYAVIDFTEASITVFSNVLGTNTVDLEEEVPLIRENVPWTAYWKAIVWFYLVSMAFADKPTIEKALDADSSRDLKRLPGDLRAMLRNACDLLRQAPSLSLWAYLLLWRAQMIHWLASLVDTWFILLSKLRWQAIGTARLLQTSRFLRIPRLGVLDLHNDSQKRWGFAILPDCAGQWSDCGTKQFYVYPSLRVVVKIFSCDAHKAFAAEVKIFNRLSKIQGAGIPHLYASGGITGNDQLCLVMSYEGEPLLEWNTEDRRQVKKLVSLLHKYKIHHHDIAPRNVVVDERGKFTLIDFERSRKSCRKRGCTEETDFGIRKTPQ